MPATYILCDGAGVMQSIPYCIGKSAVMFILQDAAENHFAFPRWLNGGTR
jgi:hypothetical protein